VATAEKVTAQKDHWRVFLLLLLSMACTGGTKELNENGNPVVTSGVSVEDTLYHLDLTKPTIEQTFDLQGVGAAAYNFVQIEVARVTNPGKLPLTFEVWYQAADKERILLGNFSLYPADNPGKFIVPTQGKLSEKGKILVSLVTPSEAVSRDTVEVAIKKITLTKG
jgi:hypothetical protein